LVELLVVIALMVLIMGVSLAGWSGMRRGAEMRRSVSTVQTTLLLARQLAVTKRQSVTVQFVGGTMTNSMWVNVGASASYSQMYLSPAIKFNTNGLSDIHFKPNGSADGAGVRTISLIGAGATNYIDVWLLTGTTKVY